jgi:hypothetical protein
MIFKFYLFFFLIPAICPIIPDYRCFCFQWIFFSEDQEGNKEIIKLGAERPFIIWLLHG